VAGTQPAPIQLRITNASGSTLSWRNFYVGNNVNSAPASADV
jgi:ABC-type taurine transport system substrate-binding protein